MGDIKNTYDDVGTQGFKHGVPTSEKAGYEWFVYRSGTFIGTESDLNRAKVIAQKDVNGLQEYKQNIRWRRRSNDFYDWTGYHPRHRYSVRYEDAKKGES